MQKKKQSPMMKLGRTGGKKTLAKHGKAHFQRASRKRWDAYYALAKPTITKGGRSNGTPTKA